MPNPTHPFQSPGPLTVDIGGTTYRHGDGIKIQTHDWSETLATGVLYIEFRGDMSQPYLFIVSGIDQSLNGNRPNGAYIRGNARYITIRHRDATVGLEMLIRDTWCIGHAEVQNGRFVVADELECAQIWPHAPADIENVAQNVLTYESPLSNIADPLTRTAYRGSPTLQTYVGIGKVVYTPTRTRGELRSL